MPKLGSEGQAGGGGPKEEGQSFSLWTGMCKGPGAKGKDGAQRRTPGGSDVSWGNQGAADSLANATCGGIWALGNEL